jgi:acyl-[acyl-carrier-protein]-phospholipid O-acyltransferase/long-chain-fatty-acid--[acyl-carrier-protein] ligase
MQWAKFAEIPVMLIAGLGFMVKDLYIVLTGIFLMGLQSCIYSPAKYGLIRDIGGINRISYGTGALEMSTFLAILTGQFMASLVSDHLNIPWVIWILMVVIALAGYGTSMTIRAEESMPEQDNQLKKTLILFPVYWFFFLIKSIRWALKIRGLNMVIAGLGIFWMLGSLIQLNILEHCPEEYKMSNTQTGLVMAGAAVGIGLGCYMAGLVSRNRVQIRLVYLGSLGMVMTLGSVYLFELSAEVFAILIGLAAFFSGFFKVPLNAWIQEKVEGRMLGEMIAFLNLMVFMCILLSAVLFGFVEVHDGTDSVFLLILGLVIAGTVLMSVFIPGMIRSDNDK